MANYCWNSVNITGNKETLDILESIFEKYKEVETFNEFGELFLKESAPRTDDYSYYGTKWWDFDIERHEDTSLSINGDSAWSPPITLLELISKKYKVAIEGDYNESGCDFAGEYKIVDGVMTMHDEFTYAEFIYRENGADGLISNYLDDESCLENYDSASDFINGFSFEIDKEDVEIINKIFYSMKKEILNKEEVINELKEMSQHLDNVGMKAFSERLKILHESLSFHLNENCTSGEDYIPEEDNKKEIKNKHKK